MSGPWIALCVVSLHVAVLTVFYFAWRRTKEHADRAVGDANAQGLEWFRQTGAGQNAYLRAGYPFAVIVVSPDVLSLTVFGKHEEFPKTSIRRISQQTVVFSKVICFERTDDVSSPRIMYWSFNRPALIGALDRLGWPVDR